jgi:hypothetical protein
VRVLRFLGLLLSLSLACDAEVTEISLEGLTYSYVFLVTADAAGVPLRSVTSVGLPTTSGEAKLPSAELRPGEDRFFVISIKEAELRAIIPGLDAGRIAKLELIVDETPPAFPTYTGDPTAIDAFVLVAAPDTTLVHSGSFGGTLQIDSLDLVLEDLADSALGGHLTLKAPVSSEHCRRPGQTKLEAFGERLDIYSPAGGGYAIIDRLIWLSDTRLLVVGVYGVTWVDRGARLPPYNPADAGRPGRWLRLDDAQDHRALERISNAALSEAKDSEGRQVLLVTSGIPADPDSDTPTLGRVRRAWLGPDGLQWQDAPPMPLAYTRPDGEIVTLYPKEIEFDGAGVAYVGTEEARIWQGTTTSTAFIFSHPAPTHFFGDDQIGGPTKDKIARIRRSDDAVGSIIVGTEGGLHIRAPGGRSWDEQEFLRPVILEPEPFRFPGMDTSNDSGELRTYLGTQTGEFLWKPTRSGIEYRPTLAYPPRFKPCATGMSEGQFSYKRRAISALDYEDGFVHMIFGECSALVLLQDPQVIEGEEAPICITLVESSEDTMVEVRSLLADSTLDPIRQIAIGNDQRSALATRPGALAVGTRGGWIYVSDW